MSDAGEVKEESPEEITPPSRGGYHRTHNTFIGDGKIGNNWLLKGRYRYSSQRHEEKYIAKIEKSLIDKRDSISERKFHGTLDDAGDKELDKDQFVRALKQRVREHGHESFFAIGRGASNTILHDLINDYHMFSVEDGIESYEDRTADTTDPAVFEPLKLDDMEMSLLVVESLLTEEMRKRMHICFDHHDAYLDLC
jgi:hypothetical protein